MTQFIIAILIISSILMCGYRRIKLLLHGFIIQALCISLLCLVLGFYTGELHYFFIAILTLIAKVIIVPYIVHRSILELKINREVKPLISPICSYFLQVVGIISTYGLLSNIHNDYLKCGIIVMISGLILMIGRKKAIMQMIGFLVLENGLVIFELSIVKMSILLEASILLEIIIISIIMGIMIFYINRTFDSINTDNLSNLKE